MVAMVAAVAVVPAMAARGGYARRPIIVLVLLVVLVQADHIIFSCTWSLKRRDQIESSNVLHTRGKPPYTS